MLNIPRAGGRALSRLLALAVALLLGATVLGATAGQAGADTPDNHISNVTLTLTGEPSTQQQQAYGQLIQGMQEAAAHRWDQNVGQTQTNTRALLRVDIIQDTRLILWFTPNDMYLRGFTTPNGLTFAFNDYPLQQVMADFAAAGSPDRNLLPPAGGHRQLPYRSSYTALTQAAGRDRSTTTVSYQALLDAQATLRTATPPGRDPAVARALMFFIQYLSEAARFQPVARGMIRIMQDPEAVAPGVPIGLQELENDWSALSRYAYDSLNGNTPPPLTVGPNYGRITSYTQLREVVMLLLGNLNQVPPAGDLNGEY
ncbi:ribosome-inactivating family protein [Kitasatospora sp. LaBMicrA B282]|uniref:ribosome-inactivating family protein n=1 Tax=Kitasatospora sp. LaBMicrA B282 TaxID=3420949 RepID=UPI003D0E8D41